MIVGDSPQSFGASDATCLEMFRGPVETIVLLHSARRRVMTYKLTKQDKSRSTGGHQAQLVHYRLDELVFQKRLSTSKPWCST